MGAALTPQDVREPGWGPGGGVAAGREGPPASPPPRRRPGPSCPGAGRGQEEELGRLPGPAGGRVAGRPRPPRGAVTLPLGDGSWPVSRGPGSPWPKGPGLGQPKPPGAASRSGVCEEWRVGGGCVAGPRKGLPDAGEAGWEGRWAGLQLGSVMCWVN